VKIAFLTESNYTGKVPINHANMRTEMAWQAILESDHFNIHSYKQVSGYDVIFIIFPKAVVKLNMEGLEMTSLKSDKDMSIYNLPVVETLKKTNRKVCNIQEGPHNFFLDYSVEIQFKFFNQLAECDLLFTHNEWDTHFYKGMFPQTKVAVIPSLMIINENIIPSKHPFETKTIIGGNFCNWYNGFSSYIVASDFDCPIDVPSMHNKRIGENMIPNLNHHPYMIWNDWINKLQEYTFAVHLMPTVAAGTFSMNCAYWGIPCIGNIKVDTQRLLFPDLSIDVSDVYKARQLAIKLKLDKSFYDKVSEYSKFSLKNSWYIDINKWKTYIENILQT
jgi:hypothetical protein